ncbi:hypothetical protein KPH14_001414 [Odynerus spinipes]|uniref:Spondin domain-containing protein n=1 Tax=Odynerus spinipes TaxID=1348599 RepID=A0AAD9VU53_9HYME|nr:hypothetical protein KPH14_001414 [Odynerus spinipes]
MCTMFAIVMIITTTSAHVLPVTCIYLYDLVMPLNESRVYELPFKAELFIDHQKHFFLFLIVIYMLSFFIMVCIVASYTLLMLYILHACGMLAVVGYMLKHAFDTEKYNVFTTKDSENVTTKIIRCIFYHTRTTRFVFYLESIAENMKEFLIALIHIISLFFWSFTYALIGQVMLNRSMNILENAYDASWYLAPYKIQKLLLMIMMKSDIMIPVMHVEGIRNSREHATTKSHHQCYQYQQSTGDHDIDGQKRFDLRTKMVEFSGQPDYFYLTNPCFVYIRRACRFIAIWPYETSKGKLYRFYLTAFLLGFFVIAQIPSYLTMEYNLQEFAESFLLFGPTISVAILYYSVNYKQADRKRIILDHVRNDWCSLKTTKEYAVIRKYAEESRFYISIVTPTVSSTNLGLMLMAIQHACGMFRIVGVMLRSVLEEKKLACSKFDEKTISAALFRAIVHHNRVIQFVQSLNSLCNVAYMVHIICGVVIFGIDIVLLLQFDLKNMKRWFGILTYIICMVAVGSSQCYIGQKLLDHSANVFQEIILMPWYMLSPKLQKLSLLMMLRSMKQCSITICKMFTPSYELFSKGCQVATSYAMYSWRRFSLDRSIEMLRGTWIRWPLLSVFLLGSHLLLVVAQCGTSIQDRQERQDRQDKLALYKITLRTYWSRARFPRHYPEWKPPAQFGKLIGLDALIVDDNSSHKD